MNCVICKGDLLEPLLDLFCGNLDNSSLYDPVVIVCCRYCGHVFNRLTDKNKQGVIDYYENEYSFNNLDSPNVQGDLPGSSSENSESRYLGLHQFIRGSLDVNSRILDIGCATGGFLRSMLDKGYSKLHGIELSTPYVEKAKHKKIDIRKGAAEDIPYDANYFDFIVADQVVEHLFDPNQIFIEVKRVLRRGGLFCISVPDAMLYNEHYFFDFYWFIMREHVQHFDLQHLTAIASEHGFEVVKHATTFTAMNSEKVVLPNLSVLFRVADYDTSLLALNDCDYGLRLSAKEYIHHSYRELEEKKILIDKIVDSGKPIHIFGASRELYYLYNNTNLRLCNIRSIVDDTEYKQQNFKFDGKEIKGRESLIGSRDHVLITATAHTDKIKSILYGVGFKGDIIAI